VAWVFLGVTVFFSLVFPFPDKHGVMGSLVLVEMDCPMVSKISEVFSERKKTRPRNPWIGLGLW